MTLESIIENAHEEALDEDVVRGRKGCDETLERIISEAVNDAARLVQDRCEMVALRLKNDDVAREIRFLELR